ncbi:MULTISPECIES: thiamine-phosphate kinase [Prochlorococcus]|uniref:thiamine-phosphate kinase n=1 Tax=Prochlorococcus TaxID=1218 RepID=UPI0005337874|nr:MULTISPECIES: thiamine-phosphate kinase [Prochlorococcus]KGG13368.1 Thiamine-monophosphate kinase [Prochlorococcus sp. MIT 0601]
MVNKKNFQECICDIGEQEILNRLKLFMDEGQIENDTALIKTSNNNLIVNTDVLVDKVHFSDKTTSAIDVGWKAIAVNLSDLASSGVDEILGVTIGLILPPRTPWEWVDGVYEGISSALNTYGGKLIGGDISKGSEKVIAITAIGSLGPLHLHRAHALPGDYLVTSGPHGLSRLGLAILLEEKIKQRNALSSELKNEAIKRHQRPVPPIIALQKLISCKPRVLPWRAAGIDTSDGLLEAINNVCKSSNCKAILNSNNFPRHPQWPIGNQWDQWCINGGEDYELVLSLPPMWAEEWLKIVPSGHLLGEITQGEPKIVLDNDKEINLENYLGFNHFK